MKQNTFIKIAVGVVVLILIIAGLVIFTSKPSEAPEMPAGQKLTEEQVLSLLENDLPGGCVPEGVEGEYSSCELVFEEGLDEFTGEVSWASISITYDGLYDDSVRASRIEANLIYRDSKWLVNSITETHQCQQGRGHQDFSEELCV